MRSEILLSMKRMASCVNATQYGTKRCRALTVFPKKALREKSQKSKLECIASNVYQVIARYVEIEGEPCVIEMINRLDDETLMDSEGRQNLVSS